ncbi:hypothetical protein RhiJN_20855 [Ceratobasidium sp. AG-Ba]|nr:hypothetical protein RhiJN_20855 [Ceratobasidium sp. AG-Ba]
MVRLEPRDKIILNPYARRYGKIRDGPNRDQRRREIRSEACDVMLERFRLTKRIKLTTDYVDVVQSLFEVTYRYIDNHRDYNRTHRYQRRFKVHPNATRRVTRSQTAINDTEMGSEVDELADDMDGDGNNQGHPDMGSEEGDADEGKGTDGEGTDGEGTDGEGTDGEGTDGEGTDGEGTDGEGTDGEGTDEEEGTDQHGMGEEAGTDEEGNADEMEYDADEDVEVDVVGLDEEEERTAEGEEASPVAEPSACPESAKSAGKAAKGPRMLVELPVSKALYAQMVEGRYVDKYGRVRDRYPLPNGPF